MPWTSLCELGELVERQGKYVEIDGFQLAVFLDGGKVYVMDNTCPHAGGPLAEGEVENGCAVCPWHYWAFRLDNGELANSGAAMVKTYPARIHQHHDSRQWVQADLPMY